MSRYSRRDDEGSEPYEYEKPVVCTRETPGGALVLRIEGTAKTFTVPKSVVHDDSPVFEEGHEGTLIVKYWFAEKEGWE